MVAPLSDGSQFDEVSGGAVLALRATATATAAAAAKAAFDGIEREEDNEGISLTNELRGNVGDDTKEYMMIPRVSEQNKIASALLNLFMVRQKVVYCTGN